MTDLMCAPIGDRASADAALRKKAGSHPNVDVRLGTELIGLRDLGEHAELNTRGKDGAVQTIRAKWVVGCDGAWSPVREVLARHAAVREAAVVPARSSTLLEKVVAYRPFGTSRSDRMTATTSIARGDCTR